VIAADTKVVDQTKRLVAAEERARYKNFPHAAASIRKSVIAGIKITKETIGWITTKRTSKRGKRIRARVYRPSPPGTPVHSHRNKGFVSRGVKFSADKDGAVIGFANSVYGDVMRVHEYGGVRFGQIFPPRPTVEPGLKDNLDRFAGDWRGAIGE
jgi:hypothetical protein